MAVFRQFSSDGGPQLNELFILKRSVAVRVELPHERLDVARFAVEMQVFEELLQLAARDGVVLVDVEFRKRLLQLIFPGIRLN